MATQPSQQSIDWNGRNGDRWVAHQDWLDAMLAPFGDAAILAAAPRAGECVLDIGCGAGTSSIAIADRVGTTGAVIGVDVSAQLVDLARRRSGDRANIRYLLGDAARLDPPGRAADLLFSRFGVMFFDDPVAAFAHLRGCIAPGGRIAFVCWRGTAENDWVRLPMGAIRGIVPAAPPPPADAPGPFSFGDATRVRAILTQAGLADIVLTPFDHDIVFGRGETRDAAIDAAVHMACEVGPLSRALADQPETIRERAMTAVRAAFAEKADGAAVTIAGAAWIVTARNPDAAAG